MGSWYCRWPTQAYTLHLLVLQLTQRCAVPCNAAAFCRQREHRLHLGAPSQTMCGMH